jgi:hypothetical protein
MLSASCHCGAVTIHIPRQPETLTNCNCSICRRYGVLWAYYKQSEIRLDAEPGATDEYAWGDRKIRFIRCSNCGCVMQWKAFDTNHDRAGVNARNFDPLMLGPVKILRLDGAGTEEYVD